MAVQRPTGVFWAEADDDAARLMGNRRLPQLALAAYMLLHRTVVAHPAYVWQSHTTRDLIIPDGNQLIVPPNISVILGNSSTTRDYITERIEKLRPLEEESHVSGSELQQYMRHGNDLWSDVSRIDERLSVPGSIHLISWSRDLAFRRLIRQDLENEIPFGPHLLAQLHRHMPAGRIADAVRRVEALTHDERRLVSVDTVSCNLMANGYPAQFVGPVVDRLHVLHWKSHEGDGLAVPLLGQFGADHLDVSDPLVFWNVMDRLLGPELRTGVTEYAWVDACRLIADLRNDALWKTLVVRYVELVELVNTDNAELRQEIVLDGLGQQYPSLIKTLGIPRLSKFGLLSVVCTILGLSTTSGLLGWGGAIGTLGDFVLGRSMAVMDSLRMGRSALKGRVISLLRATHR